ncbi:MAG: lytic murein transglycosylase [Geminicoccaceae bacterium]
MAADDPAFAAWVKELEDDARSAGISEKTIEEALGDLALVPDVVELDRKQPETRQTFEQYRKRVLSEHRVEKGRKLLKENRALLNKIAAEYKVQPRFIISLWGIETSYGAFLGGHQVIKALATLAYDGRRADLFRRELIAALRILDRGDIALDDMKGSWAGAMGQCQFMPSSFLRYAVDYDGDGRRDIWNTLPDVFASIANYLSKSGWDDKYTWGRPVKLAAAPPTPTSSNGLKVVKSLPEWQSLGVRRKNGQRLPAVALNASLLQTDDGEGPSYLVYDNFRVLMVWNRSTYFALTVSELSDLIKR